MAPVILPTMLEIVFFLLLIDSVGVNLLAWSGKQRWWHQHVPFLATHFPLAKGWTTYYLLLVLLFAYGLFH